MLSRDRRATSKELRKTVDALKRRLVKEETRKVEIDVLSAVINNLAARRDELTKK
jgi:hypothetical protein